MTEMPRIRRSRGVASGLLLALLGIWGGIIPFIGPYFHYAYTPDTTWTYNTARLYLEILPGAAVLLGGLVLMITAGRSTAMSGALLSAVGGAWFALGMLLSPLWNNNVQLGGTPTGTTVMMRIVEQVGFFTGLGVVVVFIAAVAFGRFSSLPGEGAATAEAIPAETQPIG